jgi:hypothetical protein
LELNGLVQALRHWAHYVRNGHPIKVFSDHRSLSQSLVPRADDDVHVRNLLGALAVFDVVIDYTPGKFFFGPDWLSREGNAVLLGAVDGSTLC